MGTDFYAECVLGVRLPKDSFYERKLIKHGDHEFSEEYRFHPKTGAPLWIETQVGRIPQDVIEAAGFTVTQSCPEGNSSFVYIGKHTRTGYRDETDAQKPIQVTRDVIYVVQEALSFLLGQYGLWDHKQFGLWLYLGWS